MMAAHATHWLLLAPIIGAVLSRARVVGWPLVIASEPLLSTVVGREHSRIQLNFTLVIPATANRWPKLTYSGTITPN